MPLVCGLGNWPSMRIAITVDPEIPVPPKLYGGNRADHGHTGGRPDAAETPGKRWHDASKPVCNSSLAVRTSPSSRPSMNSISPCNRPCGNPCWAPNLGPDFVTEGRALILYGKTGRVKTHLAVTIWYRAIQNGFETFCHRGRTDRGSFQRREEATSAGVAVE